MKAAGRARLLAFLVAAAIAPLLAVPPTPQTPQPGQPAGQQPAKLKPPLVIVGMPLNYYLDFLDFEKWLNALLRKPCLTAAEQADAFFRAKDWADFLRKLPDATPLTPSGAQEALDYASITNGKLLELQKRPRCPSGGATTTPTPPPATPGKSSAGGTGTPGAGQTTTPPQTGTPPEEKKPCPDTKKDDAKKTAAARKQFMEAEGALTAIEEQLGELAQELAQQQKILAAKPVEPATSMEDIEKVRQANDARRRIGEIEKEISELNKARAIAQQMQQDALEELKKYGADPFGPCEPSDEFMMLPNVPGSFNASLDVPSQAALAAAFDTVDLAGDAVDNPLAGDNLCCEPGVQKLVITIVLRRAAPVRPKPQIVRSRDWLTLLARFARRFPIAILEASASSDQATAGRPAPVHAVITSLGESQGDAFRLQVVNQGPRPVRLVADGVVVEPVKRAARDEAQKALDRLAPQLKNAQTATGEGYCLMHAVNPPSNGMFFRVAPPAVQAQFAGAREVLRAAAELEASRVLTPDSDPQAYIESIKQYAVWTKLERWDARKFADAWVEMTRKRIVAMKGQWTGQLEAAVRSLVPGRWRDIQLILAMSEAPPARVRNAATP